MTVNTTTITSGPYTATGGQTIFDYTFRADVATDLDVYVNEILRADYTVLDLGEDAGGQIEFNSGLTAGDEVYIRSSREATQDTEFSSQGGFYPEEHERAFDKLTYLIQQLGDKIKRTLRIADTKSEVAILDLVAGKFVQVNATGDGFQMADRPVEEVLNDAVVNTVADLAFTVVVPGAVYNLKEYHAGTGYGGGDLLGVAGSTTYDNGETFAGSGGYFRRINKGVLSIYDFGAKVDETTDDSVYLRAAISSVRPISFPKGTTIVTYDPASAFDDGGTTRYSYCLSIPSNKTLIFEEGAVIKQKAGAQSWNRVVVINGASNVKIFGELTVDANLQNVGTPTNEHMHGVFIFNAVDCYIQRINSINARGDNIFIGGSDEATYGKNVRIDSVYAKTAGRKNLTFHYCDNLSVGDAELDNASGGASSYSGGVADDTDKHCFDVEPDSYTGAKSFTQYVGRINTYGLGNDFTAGTSELNAEKWVLNIDSFTHTQSASSATVAAWIQYAITINVGKLILRNLAGMDESFLLQYGAVLRGGVLEVKGASSTATGYLVSAKLSGSDYRPTISFDSAYVENTVGGAIDIRSAIVDFNVLKISASAYYGLRTQTTSSVDALSGSTTIGHLISVNTGAPTTGAVVLLTNSSFTGYPVSIICATQIDTRATKAGYFFESAANSAGILLCERNTSEAIPVANWTSTDKFYRLSGPKQVNSSSGPAVFICQGTPESMITAVVGSTACRVDGGASTTIYIKQSGGLSNTGWVAK